MFVYKEDGRYERKIHWGEIEPGYKRKMVVQCLRKYVQEQVIEHEGAKI